ncbi:hypothetical protein B0H13DRAFT_2316411 [Mycena leptocephala]|nr:hypothetical protein B0H13DRAFT_2316411 [Mycena leptocephala]
MFNNKLSALLALILGAFAIAAPAIDVLPEECCHTIPINGVPVEARTFTQHPPRVDARTFTQHPPRAAPTDVSNPFLPTHLGP